MPFAFSYGASGSSFDLNVFEGDASGNATGNAFDLNFFLALIPTGNASRGALDLNLGVFFQPFCGDRVCQNFESCGSCASDCGACPVAPPSGGGTNPVVDDEGGAAGGGGGGKGGGGGGSPDEKKKAFIEFVEQINDISVEQGEFESFIVKAKNSGNVRLNALSLSIEGIPADWYSIQKDKEYIDSGEAVTFAVKVSVPADAKVKAYPVFVRFSSDVLKKGFEITLRVLEKLVSRDVVFRDVRVSNAIVGEEGRIVAVLFNSGASEVTYIVSIDAPKDWELPLREVEVTVKPGEEKEVSFSFKAPGDPGAVSVSLSLRDKAGGEAFTKRFFVIINKRDAIGALVVASYKADVIVSAVFFVVLTGLVIAFFVVGRRMFFFTKK